MMMIKIVLYLTIKQLPEILNKYAFYSIMTSRSISKKESKQNISNC